jgi:dGTPase
VEHCAQAFVDNEDAILRGESVGPLVNIISERPRKAYAECERVSWDKIYKAPDVVDIELAGNRIITFLLQKLVHAVCHPQLNYSSLLLSRVPAQFDVYSADLFTAVQAVLDHLSSMTDVYALDLYRKLNGMSLPAV